LQSYDIAGECPVFPTETKHLLATGIGLLFFAEFGCAANLAARFNFYQLVDDANGWSISRSGERGADAEGIDACAITQQHFDAVFVEVTRDDNLHVLPAAGVQSLAGPSAIRKNIPAVQTDGVRLTTSRYDFVDSSANIIGIHEQRGLFRKHIQKIAEGFAFVIMGHDPRVCLRSIHRDSEDPTSIRVGCSFAAADKSSAGSEDTSFDSMGASRSELNDRPTRRSRGHACRLAGDQCLQMDNGQQAGFYQLGLGDRRNHAQ